MDAPVQPDGNGRAPFSIVCLSSQDWHVALPTNRQQIMRIAAARGHEVVFVETGVFLGRHLARLGRTEDRRSLLRRLVGEEAVAPNIRVRKAANLVPLTHRSRVASRLNAAATGARLRRKIGTLERPVVFWLYDPAAVRVARAFPGSWIAYDCVDDYPAQAKTDDHRAFVSAADAAAAEGSNIVFTTTPTLYERQRRRNENTHLVPNVGDYSHFAPAADRAFASSDVAGLPRPVVGFAGNFSKQKFDFDLVARSAAARPEWTFLLVGPAHADTQPQLERLLELPNVHWTGAKPYEALPRYVAAFDVGLIPYLTNEYTRSCFPLKLYEYLAAGLPVVASGLPALEGIDPDVAVADGSGRFVAAVEAALARRSDADRGRRMAVAAANTWETRADRLLGLVADAIASRNGRQSPARA